MIFNILLITGLLIHPPASNGQNPEENKFRKTIEFWTETLCAVPSTKTVIFHGIFTQNSSILQELFETLLRTSSNYCGAIVTVKTYTLQNQRDETRLNQSIQTTINTNVQKHTSIDVKNQSTKDVKHNAIWNLISILNLFQDSWNIRRIKETRKEINDLWNINLIFLEDSKTFEDLLDHQAPFEWNRREHFIILAIWKDILQESHNTRSLVERILKKLWLEHRIQNVFLNEPFTNDTRHTMFSYSPFTKIDETTWGKVESIKFESQKHMLYLLSTLTYQRTLRLNGYKLNVSLFEQYQTIMKIRNNQTGNVYAYSAGYNGTDGILLGTIAKHMDFIVHVIERNGTETFGYQLKNGTYIGALADVVYRNVEACFVSYFVKKYGADMSAMEFSSHVGYDTICVTVPKAHKIPKGFRIYRIFDLSVWLCMILTQLLLQLTWYYLQVFSSQRSARIDFQKTIYQIFLVSSGHPANLPNSLVERILLVCIFVSSMTIMGTFNGALYKCFARDMYYKDIDLLTEVDNTGLPILFSSYSLSDVFGSEDDPDSSPLMMSLRSKLTQGQNSIHRTALYRNVTALLRKQTYPLLRETLIDKDGSHLLHLTHECPGKFYLAYPMPRNSILCDRFNILIDRLNQAGLPPLWHKRTMQHRALKMKININDHKYGHEDFIPFNLSDVQTCFFVLGTGLFLSTIAFFGEKGWLRKYFKKLRRKEND